MADKPSPAATPSTKPSSKKPTYISSSGQTLDSLPLTARLNRIADSAYNFLGLYFVSLLSLDPYTAAQNSRFNTRGPGRNVNANTNAAARSAPRQGGGGSGGGLFGGGRLGGGGGGGGAGNGAGRRMGTVNDVRGPECGSCG